jgi:2-keto-4-pentenoate hydratase
MSIAATGPLLALRHLVELLANDPNSPPLRAGAIISTGTLTLAMPVSAGETWTTTARGSWPLRPESGLERAAPQR